MYLITFSSQIFITILNKNHVASIWNYTLKNVL